MEFKESFPALGTEIEISISVDDAALSKKAQQDIGKAKKEYERYEKMLSRFLSDSELTHLNNNLHFSNEASHDIIELSRMAFAHFKETGGIFDPRIIGNLEAIGYREDFKKGRFKLSSQNNADANPFKNSLSSDISIKENNITFHKRMDFGGIAKGYITDKISGILLENGWKNFFVNSGGDIFFSGKDGLDPWYFSVEGIREEQLLLWAKDCGVATSGIGRRKWEIEGRKFHHLIDPRNPEKFSFDLKTVTVMAKTAREADVWAKTFFIIGKKEGIKLATDRNMKCIFLDYRGNFWISPAIKKHVYKK